MKPVYVADAKVTGGSQSEGTKPEQLFALGYAGSYNDAVRSVAQQKGLPTDGISIAARVTLLETEFGRVLAVQLRATIPGVPREEAQALMAEAHMICPYSRATRGNIAVTFSVDAAGAPAV